MQSRSKQNSITNNGCAVANWEPEGTTRCAFVMCVEYSHKIKLKKKHTFRENVEILKYAHKFRSLQSIARLMVSFNYSTSQHFEFQKIFEKVQWEQWRRMGNRFSIGFGKSICSSLSIVCICVFTRFEGKSHSPNWSMLKSEQRLQ